MTYGGLNGLIEKERLKGKREGRKEGKLEGKLEEKKETALEMWRDGEPIEKIMKYTRLSEEKINELVKGIERH